MKLARKIFGALAAVILMTTTAFAQGGAIGSVNSPVLGRNGAAISGASVAICSPLATNAALVTANTATITTVTNPISAGFVVGAQLIVTGFTGADAYFNSGSLANGAVVGGYTITAVTSTQVAFTLVHANASASSNGSLLQKGTGSQTCAALAPIYSDNALQSQITQPLTTDSNGGWLAWTAPGPYYAQFYGRGLAGLLLPTMAPCVPGVGAGSCGAVGQVNGNNLWTGTNTFNGASTFNNTVNLGDGGIINGSFSGTPTFSGVVTLSSSLALNGGAALAGTLSGSPTFSGHPDYNVGSTCANALTWNNSTKTFGCNAVAGTGTVTSVIVTTPVELSLSGCTITTSGTCAFSWASEAQNLAFMSPNGSSGTPAFRAIVLADIPAVNLASGSNGGVTGNLAVAHLNSGASASSSSFWRGDGVWSNSFTSPTVTGTVSGGASYTSPAITGTVSGGATYSGITLTSPSVTGTVSGSATYTTPVITSPTISGTATYSGTVYLNNDSQGANDLQFANDGWVQRHRSFDNVTEQGVAVLGGGSTTQAMTIVYDGTYMYFYSNGGLVFQAALGIILNHSN